MTSIQRQGLCHNCKFHHWEGWDPYLEYDFCDKHDLFADVINGDTPCSDYTEEEDASSKTNNTPTA